MSSSLLTRLFLQRSIVLTFALAEFVLGIAALLACVPMGWWLRSDVFAVPEVSPVTWLAQTIRRGAAPGEPASTPASAGDAVDPAQPAASGAQPEPALSAQDQPAAQAQPPVTPGQPATPEQKGPPASPQAQPPAVTQPPSQPGV
ncbi:MAG TPA: hypothetical protein VNK95_17110, partial [Caldilineaceae bacterium]|nr:hypothetical protein [Caldilineaceae bacterium]